jgi:type VI secretion system secreted protein VgrG
VTDAIKVQEHVALRIDGKPFEVVAIEGREAVSTLFRYDVTCRAALDGALPADLVGRRARIELRDGLGAVRFVHGLVSDIEHRAFDDGHALYAITVRPFAYPLTLGQGSRVFQDATVPEIVARVLGATPAICAGLASSWELASSYPTRVYTAQYREDDWTFCCRLLEEEGIYFWFDHGDDESVLVFADDSTRAPDLLGGAHVPVEYETGLTRARECVRELGAFVEVKPTKFSVGSFNPANPALKVAGGAGDGALEIYDAHGAGPVTPEACARKASLAHQLARGGTSGARGLAKSVRFVPGRVVEVTGHPLARLDGRYFVLEANIAVTQRRRDADVDADEGALETSFRVGGASVGYRPAHTTPRPKQPGLQIGEVVGAGGAEVHTDASGRVRVQFHWDREGGYDDKSGKWMRVAQRGNEGSMLHPRIGWNVAAFHEAGDVDAPNVLSRFCDGDNPPSYALPENKTRLVLKTKETPGGSKYNEIRFESRSGEEEMFLNASKDMEYLVKHDRTERVARDAKRKIGRDHAFDVTGNYEDDVRGDQTSEIGGDEQIQVDGTYDKLVDADETIEIRGKRTLKVDADFTDQVAETRSLRVGTAQIDTTLGYISSTAATTQVSVGGAVVRGTPQSMTEDVQGKGDQKIGLAKVELVKSDRTTTVARNMFETVGAAMLLKAGGAYKISSSQAAAWNIAFSTKVDAPTIVIEADILLTIMVGGSSITITPNSVTITTPSFDLSKASAVVTSTAAEKHN